MGNYDVVFGEQTFKLLIDLPELWGTVKKLAAQMKQVVAPLLAHQVDRIKKRSNYYDFRQQQYLHKFRKNELFR